MVVNGVETNLNPSLNCLPISSNDAFKSPTAFCRRFELSSISNDKIFFPTAPNTLPNPPTILIASLATELIICPAFCILAINSLPNPIQVGRLFKIHPAVVYPRNPTILSKKLPPELFAKFNAPDGVFVRFGASNSLSLSALFSFSILLFVKVFEVAIDSLLNLVLRNKIPPIFLIVLFAPKIAPLTDLSGFVDFPMLRGDATAISHYHIIIDLRI